MSEEIFEEWFENEPMPKEYKQMASAFYVLNRELSRMAWDHQQKRIDELENFIAKQSYGGSILELEEENKILRRELVSARNWIRLTVTDMECEGDIEDCWHCEGYARLEDIKCAMKKIKEKRDE